MPLKQIRIVWIALLCFAQCQAVWAAGLQTADVNRLTAQAAIVIEAATGKVLFEKNADARVYPASTTKIMTLLEALETADPQAVVTISERAGTTGGSTMDLRTGERVKLQDLLYGLMLVSGNDAAVAIAEHLAGSVEAFAARMTTRARALGAADTQFVNANGLPDERHYSTARDMARIAAQGYRDERFREIVKTQRREVFWQESGKRMLLENTNELLGEYPGCDGVKTGYTRAAGECLVASAARDGVSVIAVVMHADDDLRFAEAAALLDYGFSQVQAEKAYDRGALVKNVRVRDGKAHAVAVRTKETVVFPVSGGDGRAFSVAVDVPDYVKAPVAFGQKLGVVRVLYKQREIGQVDCLADQSVDAGFSFSALFFGWYEDIAILLRNVFFY